MQRSIVHAAILALVGTVTHAGTLTFTGAQLAANPAVSFPIGGHSVIGDSLQFDPITSNFPKLLVLPLYGPSGPGAGTVITVTANLTRVTDDWGPKVMIGDGTNLVGVNLSDNLPGLTAATLIDSGDFGTAFDDAVLLTSGFPSTGEIVEVTMQLGFTGGVYGSDRHL